MYLLFYVTRVQRSTPITKSEWRAILLCYKRNSLFVLNMLFWNRWWLYSIIFDNIWLYNITQLLPNQIIKEWTGILLVRKRTTHIDKTFVSNRLNEIPITDESQLCKEQKICRIFTIDFRKYYFKLILFYFKNFTYTQIIYTVNCLINVLSKWKSYQL